MFDEEWGEASDDDVSRPRGGLPCPASQRTWRHPSELEPTLAMQRPTLPADQISRSTVLVMTVVGVAAAVGFAFLLLPRGGADVARLSTATATSKSSLALGVIATENAWLGIDLLRGASSLEITSVAPGSPAEQAGLTVGDQLVAFDGDELESRSDLTMHLARTRPGAHVQLSILRHGDPADLDVTLAAAPD